MDQIHQSVWQVLLFYHHKGVQESCTRSVRLVWATWADTSEEETTVEQRKIVTSLSTLLNARSWRAMGFQLLMSLMLVARATSMQVHYKDVPLWVGWAVFILSVHHHYGNPKLCRNMHVSVGHMGVPKTAHCRSKSLEAVKVGRWLWVYDNLNVHQTVCYEHGGTF